jgi:hypothetical protein
VPKRSLYEISFLEYRKTTSDIAPKLTAHPNSLPNIDLAECQAFDLLCSKTIPELAGLRSSAFWRDVVLLVCYSEPAILHASIGLAFASKSWSEKTIAPSNTGSQNTRLIAVAEYNKSIRYLKDHFQNHKEARSLRVVLITYLMFIKLELFSGCVGKATMHLENGRKVLLELHRFRNRYSTTPESEKETMPLYFSPRPESVEDYLVNIFTHMDLQAMYFGSDRPLLKLAAHDNARS